VICRAFFPGLMWTTGEFFCRGFRPLLLAVFAHLLSHSQAKAHRLPRLPADRRSRAVVLEGTLACALASSVTSVISLLASQIVREYSAEDRLRLLQFVTGTSRLPVNGKRAAPVSLMTLADRS
jgi:hypothetical protein